MVSLQSFHRNHIPPLQRCCIGHKTVDIFFRTRLRMPPLRMVGIHHLASIIPLLRCLHLDSQEACRPTHKGCFKNLSNPLWHAPSCTCELNIPRLILPPRRPLTRPSPSWLISPLSCALAPPPTLAHSCRAGHCLPTNAPKPKTDQIKRAILLCVVLLYLLIDI
jgi:hypothetical protein